MCKDCCKKSECTMAMVGKVFVVIGGANWGLVGLGMLLGTAGGWNVLNMILGFSSVLEGVVYVLVGISAVMMIFGCKCSKCSKCMDCICTPTEAPKTEGSM